MDSAQNIIAIVTDFDDTLTDDSTTQLLRHHGVDPNEFWQGRVEKYVLQGWDPSIAFLQSILDLTAHGQPLASLTNESLHEFGTTLDFYPGLPAVVDDLKAIAGGFTRANPEVEFYVISGGFEEIIRGSRLAPHLTHFWGCRCVESRSGKSLARIQNVIDFTAKTRCLFEINKGIARSSRVNPFRVNEEMPEESRRVPFSNIIYIGDGLTDVAAFSLVESRGGTAFAICNVDSPESAKRMWWKFLRPQRVAGAYTPRYRPDDDLGRFLRLAVSQLCARIEALMPYE